MYKAAQAHTCTYMHTDLALIFFPSVAMALQLINEAVDRGIPRETLRVLQSSDANLPFPYLEAEDYQSALVMEKKNGIPVNTVVRWAYQRSVGVR